MTYATISKKGLACPYEPIFCGEGFCPTCVIYQDYCRYLKTMGRPVPANWEKKQADKFGLLRVQIERVRKDAFMESAFGSKEKKLQMQAQVDALDLVLTLIRNQNKEG